MTTDELCRRLGIDASRPQWPHALSISTQCQAGGVVEGVPTVVAGAEASVLRRRGAFLDLVYWLRHEWPARTPGRLVLGAADGALLDQIATLRAALARRMEIGLEVALEPVGALEPPDFSRYGAQRVLQLRDRATARPPALVRALDEATGPEFLVYRNIAGTTWYGKVEGLVVCAFAPDGASGTLRIGADREGDPGNRRAVKEAFREAAGADSVAFDLTGRNGRLDLHAAAAVVERLVADRTGGGRLAERYLEARLEDRVLRGVAPVRIDGATLAPVSRWGQLPTLWAAPDHARDAQNTFLDVLMRDGATPWAVELKHPAGSARGEQYRHAVGQAVLYRHFIRGARPLHAWFEAQDPPLTAAACCAAVGIPDERDARGRVKAAVRTRQEQLIDLAALFDVAVALIPDVPPSFAAPDSTTTLGASDA